MDLATAKVDLAKKILETNDKVIIGYIQSIFKGQSDNWFEELPDPIQTSLEKGLKQSARGEGRSHNEVMKKYKKWLR
jgi:predicted transcriptional regulator